MNTKLLEQVPLRKFKEGKRAIKIKTPIGSFWVAGYWFEGKLPKGEAVFSVQEIWRLMNKKDKLKLLEGAIKIKKTFKCEMKK